MPIALSTAAVTFALAYFVSMQVARVWYGRHAMRWSHTALIWLALAEASIGFTFAIAWTLILAFNLWHLPAWEKSFYIPALETVAAFDVLMLATGILVRLVGSSFIARRVEAARGARGGWVGDGLELGGDVVEGGLDLFGGAGSGAADAASGGLDLGSGGGGGGLGLDLGEDIGIALVAVLAVLLVAGLLLVGGIVTYAVMRYHAPRAPIRASDIPPGLRRKRPYRGRVY